MKEASKVYGDCSTVFELTTAPEDWVADFLGHDLRVHDKYYRLHTDAVNLAKVTKLMFMVDSGKREDAYSKDLDTIQPTLEDGKGDDSVSFVVFEIISPD